MNLKCKVIKIQDLEVLSDNTRKQIVNAEVFNWNRAQRFEIIFYNSYTALVDKLKIGDSYKLRCMLKSEAYQDPKTKEKTYFTHIVGLEIIKFPQEVIPGKYDVIRHLKKNAFNEN